MEPGKEGGTWLALSVTGKAGIVLNLSNEASLTDIPKQGRGYLIPNFITSNDSAISYLDKLYKENEMYNPFFLVLINLQYVKIIFEVLITIVNIIKEYILHLLVYYVLLNIIIL